MLKKIALILLCCVIVSFGGCRRTATDQSFETSNKPVEENSDVAAETPDIEVEEKSDEEAPPLSQTGDISVYNVDIPSLETEKKPKFMKIEIGTTDDFEYGVFALDSSGKLYFCTSTNTAYVVEEQVKDFSYTESMLYVLKENGDVISTEEYNYKKDSNFVLLYSNKAAKILSDSVVVLSDHSIIQYCFATDSWNPVDILASKIDADYFGAAIIDTNNTLWYFERQTEELYKIADNVIDCSYTDRNKVYYSNDLWYVTKDNKLHLHKLLDNAVDDKVDLPTDIVSVSGYMGKYIAENTDGTYIWGSLFLPSNIGKIKIHGQDVDTCGNYYAILDKDGNIHFGEIQANKALTYNKIIKHP